MRSKKPYFSNLTNRYKTSFKKTWQLIEEAFVKGQVKFQVFPNKASVNKKNVTNIESIAINSNNFLLKLVQLSSA